MLQHTVGRPIMTAHDRVMTSPKSVPDPKNRSSFFGVLPIQSVGRIDVQVRNRSLPSIASARRPLHTKQNGMLLGPRSVLIGSVSLRACELLGLGRIQRQKPHFNGRRYRRIQFLQGSALSLCGYLRDTPCVSHDMFYGCCEPRLGAGDLLVLPGR